jgi:hypothetical protein
MVRSAMSEYFLPELRETMAEVLLFLNFPLLPEPGYNIINDMCC